MALTLVLTLAVPGAAATTALASTAGATKNAGATAADLPCETTALQAAVKLPHVSVSSVVDETSGSFVPPGTTTPITGLPDFCQVSLVQTDPAGNPINIVVWLPAKWNGNFQGVGGAGFSCGIFYTPPGVAGGLAEGMENGYATASTDCGVPVSQGATGSWALRPDGTLNWPLIQDFASAGMHDMSVAGKAVTQAFYAHASAYSYFYGCSTGGREGLMEAQRYPADYNGIVSGAPAINWTKFIPAEIWPELVMSQSHDFLPACKESAFTQAVIKACGHGPVAQGWINDPGDCHWSPYKLVGLKTPCGTITQADAAVMARIWDGPVAVQGKKLWYGLERGASLAGLAGTATSAAGVTTGAPFPITVSWLGRWLQRNPSWNWQTLTYPQFDQLFAQSVSEFSSTIATDNPDLSAFRHDGGKILIWHGLADQLIFPQGTVNYYQRVQQVMGGAAATDSFARLYLAPGAQHCASAAGPAPADPLKAVVNWVQHGQAPVSILGTVTDPATSVVTLSRPLCAYPLTDHYTGGNTSEASSFACG
jgi:feruloyl esterase